MTEASSAIIAQTVEEKRKAEEETNNLYEQLLRIKSESEHLLEAQTPSNLRIAELQKELGAQQRQHEKVRGLLEDRVAALLRQVRLHTYMLLRLPRLGCASIDRHFMKLNACSSSKGMHA